MRYLLLALLLALSSSVLAASPVFEAGKQYQVLPQTLNNAAAKPLANVVEFFSYGCPACFHLESTIEQWVAQKPAQVTFARIPVVFHPNWLILAKAYYVAQMLNVETKVTPKLFSALHEQGRDLSSEQALSQFFAEQGVQTQDFASTFNFAPVIVAKLNKGDGLMRQYRIMQVPSLVINGKYVTNVAMTNGNAQQLLQVVNFLLQKKS
jgi:thiol:disulfide interchange protein DsbA